MIPYHQPSEPGAATAGDAPPAPPIAAEPGPVVPGPARPGLRAVLRHTTFRRLWYALSLSSLGDWLGLLATTSLAQTIIAQHGGSYAAQNFAVGGVVILRLVPALLLGPLAGALADRFDRRRVMVVGDLTRFALFLSIPLVGGSGGHSVTWLLAASFLIECASLLWIPAKEATVPNLVPRAELEQANQLSLLTTYGSAPLAAVVFTVLAKFTDVLSLAFPFFDANPVDLALYFNAATFLFSAATIARLSGIPARAGGAGRDAGQAQGLVASIVEGWRYVGTEPLVRGLVIGILGAFASGGAVVAVARVYVADLGGGDAGYGVLFGAVFLGLALGMVAGPRVTARLSRKRVFGAAIVAAGLMLAAVGLIANLALVVLFTFAVGAFAGIGWITGYTLLGLEVDDAVRGRTFAFVQSAARIVLMAVLAAAPLLAGLLGRHALRFGDAQLRLNGAALTLLLASVCAVVVGVTAYRQMDDHREVSLVTEVLAALRGEAVLAEPGAAPAAAAPVPEAPPAPAASPGELARTGLFVAFEGGEGAGKSTQVSRLAEALRASGYDVVVTREPGATLLGRRLRRLLLDRDTGALSPRAEALLYAADRAEHVDAVIRPALARGAVVLTDRYADSSLAYQGSGRELGPDDVERLSRWATDGLVPDLTVLLDVPTRVGLGRGLRRDAGAQDRLESEPVDFHERVRRAFRALAEREPGRYLVLEGDGDPDGIAAVVRERVAGLLPPPAEAADTARPLPVAETQ